MRLAAACLLLGLSLAQLGNGQRAAGVSIATSSGMGYRNPSVGGWLRGQAGPLRVLGEIDDSRKGWMGDGMSWRVLGTLDSPQWHSLSALGVASLVQHRNGQWVKTGAAIGGGLRWGPLYSWYTLPDISPNRVTTFAIGMEVINRRIYWGYEINAHRFDQGTERLGGWDVTGRVGFLIVK